VTTGEFLLHLRELGVRLRAEGARVHCSAPEGVLTAALQAEIAQRKPEILALLEQSGAGEIGEPVKLGPMPRDGALPLSFGQQRLWFLDQLEPGTSAYTIAGRRRMRGPLDVTALTRALGELVRRHEALRTTFPSRSGEPVQRIGDPETVKLEIIDLEAIPAPDRSRAAEDFVGTEVHRPFDLACGPLFRPVLLRFGPEEHELLVSVHHIIVDGWSLGIIARELDALYSAYVAGRPSSLPEPLLQYADFALWQRRSLTGDVLEAQRRYWRERLGDRPEPLKLHADYAWPHQQTFAGASYDFELPKSLADSLRQLSRREGASLFMTLLAGFKMLLSRYTDQDEIVVGIPMANRTRVDLESIVGFFANTLVLRTRLDGDPTFLQLLQRVREVSLGAFDHQDMPFEQLVEELQPEREMGENPLFQVAFVFQGASTGPGFAFVTVASPFDITLFVQDGSDGKLRVTIEYKRDLFASSTIARLGAHYRTVLECVAADPDSRLSTVPLLKEHELRQVLIEWNDTATDYPRDRSIHGLFEDQVAATPDAIAVAFEGASLTYRELDRRANQLAHHLRSMGVGPERPVGVWMGRSIEAIVALLAILKAGGAYTPLDLMTPPERVAFMVRDSKMEILLTRRRMLERLPAHGARTFCLDADWWSVAAQPGTPPPDRSAAESLAYIMYTSGSTGQPKAVEVTHRNVVRLVKATDYASFGPAEVFLQLAPLSFDASTFEIWGALLNGGRLAIAPPGVLSVDELGLVLDRNGVTTLWLTAGLFQEVVDHRIEVLRPLRQLLTGGDVVSGPHARRVMSELPGCRLINGYGPTEGTTFSCCHSIASNTGLGRSVPIGRPIANTRVYVLDRSLCPVPIGVPGELWIAGDGLARAYLGRPDLTAERFVVHRLSDTIEERLYRSGDIVRWLADGTLDFIGRRDDQVKLRGYRVELGEVETTLSRHPGVRNVAVVVSRDPGGGDKRIVAYVVGDTRLGPHDLREFLRAKLPEYMVPAAFVILDRLPLSPNGKVDRRALPEPTAGVERAGFSAPVSQIERRLVTIWEEVLAVKQIGTRDNFFDLGGHSLLAVRMFARLEESQGLRLPLATLFQAPTIEGLAAIIGKGELPASRRSLVAIQPEGDRVPLFAVPGVGGNVLCYNDLARLLGRMQPFYGLQSRGLDGKEKPLTRIVDIAAAFLDEVREVQTNGPYSLLGACMGGVVAFEMAQQLRAAGQEVGLLVLLESWVPGTASGSMLRLGPRGRAFMELVGSRLRLYVQRLSSLRGRQRLDYLRGRLKMITQVIAQHDIYRGDRSDLNLRTVTQANLLALEQYAPRVYPGRAVLFRAAGRRVAPHEDRRDPWRQFISGGLEIHTLPGDDSGLMLTEPEVRVVARQLKACIGHTQDPARSAGRA
jgi:amino acid adenylation domain-containing protein